MQVYAVHSAPLPPCAAATGPCSLGTSAECAGAGEGVSLYVVLVYFMTQQAFKRVMNVLERVRVYLSVLCLCTSWHSMLLEMAECAGAGEGVSLCVVLVHFMTQHAFKQLLNVLEQVLVSKVL